MAKTHDFKNIKAIKLTVPPKEIYYLSWNLDACEGLGFLETNDAAAGQVTIYTPAQLERDVYSFLDGAAAEGIDVTINNAQELDNQ